MSPEDAPERQDLRTRASRLQRRALRTSRARIAGALLAAASRRPPASGFRVLAYHAMPQADVFRAQVATIRSVAEIVDETALLEALAAPERDPDGRCRVVLTFDDGYRSCATPEALRLVEELGLRPTMFVVAAAVDPGLGSPRRLLRDGAGRFLPLCTAAELGRAVSAGWFLGSHTSTHWDCGTGSSAELELEIGGSKAALEQALGVRVREFAFPYGRRRHVGDEAVRIAAASGYEASFTTRRGRIEPARVTSPHRLPRDVVEGHWTLRHLRGCLAGGLDRLPTAR